MHQMLESASKDLNQKKIDLNAAVQRAEISRNSPLQKPINFVPKPQALAKIAQDTKLKIDGDNDLPGKGELRVEGGDYLIFDTPGGGGFGAPTDRDPDALALDLKRGLVTAEGAKAYGGDA